MTMKTQIFVFEIADGSFKGIEAATEEEARDIAEIRNHDVVDLVRVEEMTVFDSNE